MEGSAEDTVEEYIRIKAAYFWGYVNGLENVFANDRYLEKMVLDRFEYDEWEWSSRIPGLFYGVLEDEGDSTTPLFNIKQVMESLDSAAMLRIRGQGGLDEYQIATTPEGTAEEDRSTIAFSLIPNEILSLTKFIMDDQRRRANVDQIIESIKRDYYRTRRGRGEEEVYGGEEETFPPGADSEAVIEKARTYVPFLDALIQNKIRLIYQRHMEDYLLKRELYYRTASSLFSSREFRSFDVDDLRIAITREAIIDRDVRERDKRRAENVMFRYYFLKKLQASKGTGAFENLATIPDEIATHITGYIGNVWPDGYAEFELANSFEDYVRKDIAFKASFPDAVFSEDMAIYPEEQKDNLVQLMSHVEAVVRALVNTPMEERESFYKEREVDAVENRLAETERNYAFLMENHSELFEAFHRRLVNIARSNPERIDLETRSTEEHPISPTEMRLERIHTVLETFGRRDAYRFLERMMQENINAIQVNKDELQRQRNALRDAIELGLKTKPPPKKRSRRVGTRIMTVHVRHSLDYSTVKKEEGEKAREREAKVPRALYF